MLLVGVVVGRYIDIRIIINNFPYSTCIRSFLAAASSAQLNEHVANKRGVAGPPKNGDRK